MKKKYIKLIELQHFFETDIMIKKNMYNLAPTNIQYFDETTINTYTDKLNDFLIYAFSELKYITIDIFEKDSKTFNRICYLEKNIKNNLYSCGFDIDKLKLFYKNYISNMEMNFIDSVKNDCVGYKLDEKNL